MFAWLESRIDEFRLPANKKPPYGLVQFYWFFSHQIWPWLLAVLAIGGIVALIEVSLLVFLGDLIDILKEADPSTLLAEHGNTLLWMGVVVLVVRPLANFIHFFVADYMVAVKFNSLIRWQAHRYVLRQSYSFFQNDFAGRIANRVMQTPQALRQSVMELVDAVWFVLIYAVSALVIFAQSDIRLTFPVLIWFALYVMILFYFVPRVKRRSTIASHSRSTLTGRIVDSYSNIMTVKLFAHGEREDAFAREAIADHTGKLHDSVRLQSGMNAAMYAINGVLLAGTGAISVWLWQAQVLTIGAIAAALALVIRIINMSNWIMWVITSIFENVGMVDEGIETIAQSYDVVDKPGAQRLEARDGAIHFDSVCFHYGKQGGVIDNLDLGHLDKSHRLGLLG